MSNLILCILFLDINIWVIHTFYVIASGEAFGSNANICYSIYSILKGYVFVRYNQAIQKNCSSPVGKTQKMQKQKKQKKKKRQWGRRENQCLAPGEQRAHVRCQTGNTFLQYLRVKCFIRLLRHWERMCMCMICTSEPWINIFKLLFISSLSGGRGDHFD